MMNDSILYPKSVFLFHDNKTPYDYRVRHEPIILGAIEYIRLDVSKSQLQAAKERIRALREALKYIAQHVDLDKDFNHIWTIEAKHAMSALQSDDKGAT